MAPSAPRAERPEVTPPLLLDAAGVAQALGVSVRTIRRLHDQAKLPRAVHVGRGVRWVYEELVAWVRSGCPPRDGAMVKAHRHTPIKQRSKRCESARPS